MNNFVVYFVFCIKLYLISGQNNKSEFCDSIKCYQSVNSSLQKLIDLIDRLNSTTSSAKLPTVINFEEINKQISELKNLENESQNITQNLSNTLKKLNQTDNSILENQKILDEIIKELLNISQRYNSSTQSILKEARKTLSEFEELLVVGRNTSDTCKKNNNKYREFENILKNLTKDFDQAKDRANKINNELDKSFKEGWSLKEALDEVLLPSNLIESYVSAVELKLNDTINHLKNNSDLLKELLEASNIRWKKQLEQKAKEIMGNLTDLNKINEQLINYENILNNLPTFNFTVDDESRKLPDVLKNDLTDLDKRFGNLDFSEELPTKKKLDCLEKDIWLLRNFTQLMIEYGKLKDELELLRIQEIELQKVNCTVTNSVSLT